MKAHAGRAIEKRSMVFGLLFCATLFSQPAAWRVNTIAGSFSLGNDGPGVNATLARPQHLAYDRTGNLYIADMDNHQIRRLSPDGRIVAIAGTGIEGNSGDGGPALLATLNRPRAVALYLNQLFIADSGNYRIRVVNLSTGAIEAYAGQGVPGSAGDGGSAKDARFRSITFITVDERGNLLISDTDDNRVRRINRQTGVITTFTGAGPLNAPEGLAVDPNGVVYIGDRGGVLRVDPFGNVQRVVRSAWAYWQVKGLALDVSRSLLFIAGSCGVSSLDLVAGIIRTDAEMACASFDSRLSGVAVDPGGGVAISDTENHRIHKLNTVGIVNTIAGRPRFSGDNGPARDASLFHPNMAIPDGDGGYFLTDTGNCVTRRVSAAGLVLEVRRRGTRVSLVLDDRSGRIEVAVSEEVHQRHRDLVVKDALLVVEGGLRFDEFSDAWRIHARTLTSLTQLRERLARRMLIEWPSGADAAQAQEQLATLLAPWRGGECAVVVRYGGDAGQALLTLGEEWKVRASAELVESLERVFGAVRVAYAVAPGAGAAAGELR